MTSHESVLHATEPGVANVCVADLVGTLAHDLMQPVAALDGYLSLIERDATELTDEHRSWLDGAMRGKERLVQVIDALYRNAADEHLAVVAVDLKPTA